MDGPRQTKNVECGIVYLNSLYNLQKARPIGETEHDPKRRPVLRIAIDAHHLEQSRGPELLRLSFTILYKREEQKPKARTTRNTPMPYPVFLDDTTMKTKNDYFYQRSQHYRNSSKFMMGQEGETPGLKDSPNEASNTRLPDPDSDTSTTLWYSSSEDELEDYSCIRIPQHRLSDLYDQEAAESIVRKTRSLMLLPNRCRTGRHVRFCSGPPEVCWYEKPSNELFNQLYYTCHEMQKMHDEFFREQQAEELMGEEPTSQSLIDADTMGLEVDIA